MRDYLVVVDMQKDFIDGALGTAEAVKIVPAVQKKIREFDGQVVFTMDTHPADYLDTQEGRNLPVEHCIRGTDGWKLEPGIAALQEKLDAPVFEKPTFGSRALGEYLLEKDREEGIGTIEVIGLCTDICVVSNALLIKAFLPEIPVITDSSCCAGVTPGKHRAALETMASCQIQVIQNPGD